MRGLTIVVAESSPERLRTAFEMALARTALGGSVRLFLNGRSVALIRLPVKDAEDADYAANGLPTLAQLHDETLASGVRLILCQSGLQLTATTRADYDQRLEYGGMVSVMADSGGDRLVVV